MLAAIAAAALALLSPLFGNGFGKPEGDFGRQRPAAPTVLHPRSLEPVGDAPRLPRTTKHLEVSPGGDRVVGTDGGDLVFASARTGRPLGRLEIGGLRGDQVEPVLSWIAHDRLLVLDHHVDTTCPEICQVTRVRVVDPIARQLVGEPLTFDGTFRTARIAGRQVILLARVFSPWAGQREPIHDQVPTVVVLDDRGAVEHVTPLPGLVTVASLDRNLIAVMERDPLRPAVYRYDAARGTIAARRAFPLREPVWESDVTDFLLPSPRGAALFGSSGTRYRPLTRSRLESLGPRWARQGADVIAAAGSGVVTRTPSRRSPGTTGILTAYSVTGDRRWARRTHAAARIGVIGPYVYVQHAPGSRRASERYHVDVLRVRDGRRVARVPGRFDLIAPSEGRSWEQVPKLVSVTTD